MRATQELEAFAGLIPPIPVTPSSETSTTLPQVEQANGSPMQVEAGQKRKDDQEEQTAAPAQKNKWPKGPGKGSGQGQGYNQDRRPRNQNTWWSDNRNQGSSRSSENLKNLVRAMGRLLIRQEDSLSILQQDTQLMLFLKNRDPAKQASEDWSIVQALFLVGQALAGAEGENPQPSYPAAAGSPPGLSVGCPADEGEATADRPSSEGFSRTKRSDGEWDFPLPTMGFREEGVCAGDPGAPLLPRRGGGSDDSQAVIDPPARDSSLSRNAEAHSRDDQRSGALHARNTKPLSGISTVLSLARKAQPQRVRPPHCSHLETGEALSFAPREHCRSLAPGDLAQFRSAGRQNISLLQLQNPSNYCYGNPGYRLITTPRLRRRIVAPRGPCLLSAALRPAAESSLQSLIDVWSAQAIPHAVRNLPAVMALQLARFTDHGDKCPGKISPQWSFAVPYYRNDGVEIEHALYKVTAIIYHIGESILQGHYRAVLLEDGLPIHHTDDGRKAVKVRPRDLDQILRNCYVIFAVKSS